MCGIGPILMWVLAQPALSGFLAGLMLLVAGHAVRVWAAGHLNKLNELTTSGPYRYTRNPMYIGSFLIVCGYSLMTGRADVAAAMIGLFVVFHGGAIIYEEQLLRGTLGEQFLDYCKRVPRLLPLRSPLEPGPVAFSWSMAIHNREHRAILCTAATAALFALILIFPQAAPLQLVEAAR